MVLEIAAEEDEQQSDEFYPELLAILVNFIDKYEHDLFCGSRKALDVFGAFANQALFHISKESSLQFVLEDSGWFVAVRDNTGLPEMFQHLKYDLTGLYWEQIGLCLPFEKEQLSNAGGNLMGCEIDKFDKLSIEKHPNLFNDYVGTYSYLPNILLSSLLKDSKAQTSTTALNFEGACMLADISGFTKLSGACCEEGTSGLDRLHDACSGYLGKFVQTVYTYQGDGK